MDSIKRIDYYFEEPGPQNTDDVIKAVVDRLKETGIKTVVVASDTGETALKVYEVTKGLGVKVVAISWKEMDKDKAERLKKSGVTVMEEAHTPLSVKERRNIMFTLYTLGQGLKVAVEVVLIAVDNGAISVGEEVIAIGGTGRGADTAIVIKASSTEEMIGREIDKRLEIREVIAMPRRKKWWE